MQSLHKYLPEPYETEKWHQLLSHPKFQLVPDLYIDDIQKIIKLHFELYIRQHRKLSSKIIISIPVGLFNTISGCGYFQIFFGLENPKTPFKFTNRKNDVFDSPHNQTCNGRWLFNIESTNCQPINIVTINNNDRCLVGMGFNSDRYCNPEYDKHTKYTWGAKNQHIIQKPSYTSNERKKVILVGEGCVNSKHYSETTEPLIKAKI